MNELMQDERLLNIVIVDLNKREIQLKVTIPLHVKSKSLFIDGPI